MPDIHITEHGYARGQHRLGLGPPALRERMVTVQARGLRVGDTRGSLKGYLRSKTQAGDPSQAANQVRVWGRHVYLFFDRHFITVLDLPPQYYDDAAKLLSHARPR